MANPFKPGADAGQKSLPGMLFCIDSNERRKQIPFLFNPDTLTRTLSFPGGSGESDVGTRSRGLPVETLQIEVEIEGSYGLGDKDPLILKSGISPTLAALESLVYPTSKELEDIEKAAAQGRIAITLPQEPLVYFSWGPSRVLPVRITEFSVTEEAFDQNLNPLRAKVKLSLRVLSHQDLGTASGPGGKEYLVWRQAQDNRAKAFFDNSGAAPGNPGQKGP